MQPSKKVNQKIKQRNAADNDQFQIRIRPDLALTTTNRILDVDREKPEYKKTFPDSDINPKNMGKM